MEDATLVRHKGFEILACPVQLQESGLWTTQITISRHSSDGIVERPFSAGQTFPTRDEAIFRCIEFGMNVIDGLYPDCRVDDL